MVGCFGTHPEDRARARELDNYLNAQAAADAVAEMIDKRANDLYRAKLASLPVTRYGGIYKQWIFCNVGDALRELHDTDMNALACAIRDNDESTAGKEIIKLVTAQLRKEAQEEAENE